MKKQNHEGERDSMIDRVARTLAFDDNADGYEPNAWHGVDFRTPDTNYFVRLAAADGPGEGVTLHMLSPNRVHQYEIRFDLGVPVAVMIATTRAALADVANTA